MKIKPETAEEINKTESSIEGIFERISLYRKHNALVSTVLNLAEIRRLTKEETFILLSYNALCVLEAVEDEFLKYVKNNPYPQKGQNNDNF